MVAWILFLNFVTRKVRKRLNGQKSPDAHNLHLRRGQCHSPAWTRFQSGTGVRSTFQFLIMVTARFFNLLNHAGNQFFLPLTLALNLQISICFSSNMPNQAFWGKVPCQLGIQSTAHVAWPKTTLGPNAKIVSVVGHAYGLGMILATVVSCLDHRAPLLEHSGREFAPSHFDLWALW